MMDDRTIPDRFFDAVERMVFSYPSEQALAWFVMLAIIALVLGAAALVVGTLLVALVDLTR